MEEIAEAKEYSMFLSLLGDCLGFSPTGRIGLRLVGDIDKSGDSADES
jgi:hypothetical protein